MNNVEGQLRKAGWYPGRQTSIEATTEALITDGYLIWDRLGFFLMEYCGLTVHSSDGSRSVRFDAVQAARGVDPAWPRAYSTMIGSCLVPVGERSHMTIYLAENGSFYGGFDNDFGLLGSTVIEMLGSVLDRDPPVTLNMSVPD